MCGTSNRHPFGNPERKRSLGIPEHNWEDNIETDFHKESGERGDLIKVA